MKWPDFMYRPPPRWLLIANIIAHGVVMLVSSWCGDVLITGASSISFVAFLVAWVAYYGDQQ